MGGDPFGFRSGETISVVTGGHPDAIVKIETTMIGDFVAERAIDSVCFAPMDVVGIKVDVIAVSRITGISQL